MRTLLLLAFSFLAFGCSESNPIEPATPSGGAVTVQSTDGSQMETALQAVNDGTAVLIDVRRDEEWQSGHFEKAIHIPLSKITDSAADASKELDKSKTIYTHCAKGKRATTAAAALTELGFKVEPLKTTYAAIKEAGFTEATN